MRLRNVVSDHWENCLLGVMLALISLIPFSFMPWAAITVAGRHIPVHHSLFLVLGGYALYRSTRVAVVERKVPLFVAASLLFSVVLIIPRGSWTFTGLVAYSGFVSRLVAVGWLGYLVGRDPKKRQLFVSWISILGAAVAVLAVAEPLTGRQLFIPRTAEDYPWMPDTFVAVGAIGQPLPLSAFLNVIFPLTFLAWLKERKPLPRIASVLIAVGILMTFRRSGYVVLGATVAGMLLFSEAKVSRRVLVVAAGLILGTVGMSGFRGDPHRRLNPLSWASEVMASPRFQSMQTVVRMVEDRPIFGIGTRRYETDFRNYHNYPGAVSTPDSQYLRFLAENGLAGFTAFVVYALFLVLTLWRGRTGEGLAYALSVTGYLLVLLVLDGLYWAATGMAFFAVAGVGFGRLDESPANDDL